MNVLIVYATVEGQTGRIARHIGEFLRNGGHSTHLVDADETERLDLEHADKVILAASVHQRRHPRNFEAMLGARKDDLAKLPSLLLSVSLNAAFPEGRDEAREYLLEMKMRTGFEPSRELLVGGAVRTDRYDYFAMMVVRHVVLRGRKVDLSQDMHEFTDWAALDEEVAAFIAG